MPKRPTTFCESCRSTVYADDVHSCFDASAVEREARIMEAERRVIEAAVAYIHPPDTDPWGYGDGARHTALRDAVDTLRGVWEADHP